MYLKKYTLLLITPVLIMTATYLSFDRYLQKTSSEFLSGWLRNEAISIQENQILSAVTKHERALKSSDFLRGIWILDDSAGGEPRVLADFGEKYLLSKNALPNAPGEIEVARVGIFHRVALYRFPKRPDLTIVFNINPDFAWPLFLTNLFAIIALLIVFFYMVRRDEKRAANTRLALLRRSRALLGEFAAQVAHDIKSPLTALETAIKYSGLPEEQRLDLRRPVATIRDINNSLVDRSLAVLKSDGESEDLAELTINGVDPGIQLLPALIDHQLSITRLQYRQRHDVDISAELGTESYGIFAHINPTEFKRVLSNLLTNAVEAIDDSGRVQVALSADATHAHMEVTDTGKGIPAEVLPLLGNLGVSFGKPDSASRGRGLHFVKNTVESWGGDLEIKSAAGATKVAVTVPLAKTPSWFASELKIAQDATIVVLDDDPSIHQVWKSRTSTVVTNVGTISTLNYSSAEEMTQGVKQLQTDALRARQALYLCDYELAGSAISGLDLIVQLGIANQSVLVTSHFDDLAIIERCRQLGCRIIPKNFAGAIPIRITATPIRPDYVLIDNDGLIHQSWKSSAKAHKKTLQSFYSVEEFLSVSDGYDKLTPIYVDSDLGSETRGEDMARYIHASGFRSIYLQTGHPRKSFTDNAMTWIKDIVGKAPPWEIQR